MTEEKSIRPGESAAVSGSTVVVKVEGAPRRSVVGLVLLGLLAASIMMNLLLIAATAITPTPVTGVRQILREGDAGAKAKLAVIDFTGTIMPPFTDRWIRQIRHAREDDSVKGVLLEIDSPGGLVADSHQLYHELRKLTDQKPVYVAMKRIAASGGLYIAMAAGAEGKIYIEPTTWTGSIGVIIPRYNAAELAEKIGVKTEPLATGPLKGSLSPFRNLREDERAVWDTIIDDAFERFLGVIADNRSQLDHDAVRALATGQIYTANQALENGLADENGYSEDALRALAESIGLTKYQVVDYAAPVGLIDVLIGMQEDRPNVMDQLMEAGVPRAFYYCSWNPMVPAQ